MNDPSYALVSSILSTMKHCDSYDMDSDMYDEVDDNDSIDDMKLQPLDSRNTMNILSHDNNHTTLKRKKKVTEEDRVKRW